MPLSASEASVEAEIKTKGLTGPRLTPADIDREIDREDYWIVPLSTTTVCALTLKNGFVVIGHSACADPANFDVALGKRISRDKAREQIWALEGYLLKESLYQADWQKRIPIDVALAETDKIIDKIIADHGFDVC